MKADVIMAGTSRRKNLAYKKPKCAVVLPKIDQSQKPPPPFRFGKLTYNEDKLLSRDIKSTKLEDRNSTLTIIGTKSSLRITAKLNNVNGYRTRRNGHCRKNQQETQLDSQNTDVKASTDDNPVNQSTNDDMTNKKNGELKVNEKTGDCSSRSKDAGNRKESYFRMSSSKPAPFRMIQTVPNSAKPDQECAVTGKFAKESREKVNRSDHGATIQDSESKIGGVAKYKECNDGRKQANLAKENRDTRAHSKDKRAVSLVKQKSKRIPTRHIKYVSELDVELRNKYRRKGKPTEERRPFKSCDRNNGNDIEGLHTKFNENQLTTEVENSSGDREGQCTAGKLKDGALNPLTQRLSNDVNNSEELSSRKQIRNGCVKSAPVTRPNGKHVESFLVRNGLIPKAGSKPVKTKHDGNLARKKSVKLRLSRGRTKSMRNKSNVYCVSKLPGKDAIGFKVGNGISREDNRLSNCWKVGVYIVCIVFSNKKFFLDSVLNSISGICCSS